MASYLAIAAISKTLEKLLKDASGNSEFNPLTIQLYQSMNFRKQSKVDISIFLYRIAVNGSQRRMPSRLDKDGKRYRSPIPVDLYYLITPWADDPEKQQRLLGWCLRTLDDTVILPSGILNDSLNQNVFRDEESVELICEPLPLQDMINIWENLKPNMPTSITYVARMVSIESTVEIVEYAPVQTRELDFNKVTN